MAADRILDGRRGDADADLVDRIRAGDEAAFALLHARYARRLERFAARILGGHRRHAEDVVQEALLRAHRALRRDHRPVNLSPWLHTLVRNCCLDELGRVKLAPVAMGEPEPELFGVAPAPDTVAEERESVHALLADIAALPAEQRHALLRRELDGVPHTELAAELGITPKASKALVHRARLNVVKGREARDASCATVQADLLAAHDERRRGAARTYRHLARCRDCRAFRDSLRSVRRGASVLVPPLGLGLILSALGVKATGGAKTAAAGGTAVLAASAAVAAPVLLGPGDPSPVSVRTPALPGGALHAGDPLPDGTAMVTRVITLARGARPPAAVDLTCPAGTRVAGMLPPRGAALSVGYAAGTEVGSDTTARVVLAGHDRPAARSATLVVGTLCRRLDARGSVLPRGAGASARAATAAATARPWTKACARHSYLLAAPDPGAAASGSLPVGRPVQVQRARAGWVRVRTDTGERGWVPGTALCRISVVGAP